MSNPHLATAPLRQSGVHDWQAEEGSTDATNLAAILDAQTEATLALAYEQRTANLIAVLHGPSTLDTNYADLKQQIIERLGL